MISVSIIEDDAPYRTLLARELGATGRCRVVNASMSAEAAKPALLARPPDVALVDIVLPGATGIALVAELAPRLPRTAFVMLTSLATDEAVFDALKAGAVGYLTKGTDLPAIEAALADAQRGGSPMSWSIARRVVQSFARPTPAAAQPAPELATLSPRERDVLEQLATGLAYKNIAAQLEVSEDTVRTHIRGVYRKLHVNCRTEAVLKYLGR